MVRVEFECRSARIHIKIHIHSSNTNTHSNTTHRYGSSIPADHAKCDKSPRKQKIPNRPVGPGPTQLALFQMTLQLMYHADAEGMNRSWWSGKDFDNSQVEILRKMYEESYFYPYMLQYSNTLRKLGDMGDLVFREYSLEVTRCTQFPLAMSFPWILIEHLLESRADINTMDNLIHVLDIYNDAGHRALYDIQQQHLYNEIEAEVNLVFDQISIILSEKVYQHLKDCAAFLELPPEYRLLLQQKRPEKFQLDQERFAVALSQKHIALLGRWVNLSKILGQAIGNYFMADLEYVVRKFETNGLETILDLEYSIRVLRRMHGLLQQSLGGQLDEFETMLNCTNETVGAISFSGRIVQHIQDELIEELFPWYIFNSGTRRYVRLDSSVEFEIFLSFYHSTHSLQRCSYITRMSTLVHKKNIGTQTPRTSTNPNTTLEHRYAYRAQKLETEELHPKRHTTSSDGV